MTSTSKNKNTVVPKLVPLFKIIVLKTLFLTKNKHLNRDWRADKKFLHKFDEQQTIHRGKLEDQPRNEFYAKSINSNKVLIRDIKRSWTSDPGLEFLSMMAARAGEKYAYAIEMSKFGVKVFEIIGQNILTDKIKVNIEKLSLEDDIIILEFVGYCFFYEAKFKVKFLLEITL
ncbi:UNKNOWN [Stylonychia lemnae]|uniref:Uncharacterized protein n=1 Tax=Stylonychia lemnae TaxID=5949 RepID=A0A078AAC6_STYLE|nr:UNKNOWN [Stylonychia lemnae]|eukprot:CDW78826.1 UNKNOWN [Stylonychia lemnae]